MITLPIRFIGLTLTLDSNNTHYFANIATCFLIIIILQVIALYFAMGNVEKLFECLSILSFSGVGILKLISLRTKQKKWGYLLNEIKKLETFYKQKNLLHSTWDKNEFDFAKYIRNYTIRYRTLFIILSMIYGSTVMIYIVSPVIEYSYLRLNGRDYPQYLHIVPHTAPFDRLGIFGYLATFFCEVLTSVYCVSVHAAFDLISVGVMIFTCGHFSLIRDYSEGITDDKSAHSRIKFCHQIHNTLINIISELENLLKIILGIYFFMATVTLCSVAVRLNMETLTKTQLISLLQYLCGIITQLFLFCRYGDAVLNECSIGMGEGPYGAALWFVSPPIRRELAMLGAGMSRPRTLRAGYFNTLNLPSFILIVRTAYSYYAVIRK